MQYNQDPDPNRMCLVSWNIGVYTVKQLLVLVLHRISLDVAFGSARESPALDDDDMFGGDALVGIAARVELPHSLKNLPLELLGVHGALLRRFNEQGGGRSTVSNHNALENEITTCRTDVVLDRPEMANPDKSLRIMTLG